MKVFFLILCVFVLVSFAQAQQIQSYSFAELEEKISTEVQKQLLIVNFWATWCAPCIKELPYFEKLAEEFPKADFKVLLVSLDMEKEKAVNFSKKKQLQSEVAFLDEVDFNAWIDKISAEWSGAIPATLMISASGEKIFHEGELSQEELNAYVKRFIHKTQKL
ncbi:TlpA family protein disulfide reductase [Catalinimonas niigatensis]|uniref:TlpA family protein disulfide reductase n=1 Tax=Catalinimonas niigatensis TaxID=1397264 RepID=UPI0026667191|nr:TlpA disulfide reductase family protein [Catalinimonas niigatensis]WPP51233.1 TlpA disulfide reductase family protein [Catalinimonas niigatensis]